MSDIFDDFKKVLKKDLVPILVHYFKDPNNKITDNLNDFLNNPQIFLKDLFENFSKNKNYDNKQESYTDIKNVTNIDSTIDDEYDDLLKRLILIEENMIQIEKILKGKN
tara:strand:+ start:618 stop:944 length:327 start_codon:yes stop_codon:yes gene_type:complete